MFNSNFLREMTKSKFSLRNVVKIGVTCLAVCMMFSSCDKDDPNGNGNTEGKPTAVMNLTATTGNGQVSLTWDIPSENGGSEVTGYEVTMDNWTNKVTKTATERSHTYTGLTNGTEYTFKVRALNANGAGAESTKNATPTAGGSSQTGWDHTKLPENVKIYSECTYTTGTTVQKTFTDFTKIGNDYYAMVGPYAHKDIPLMCAHFYLKYNGSTWTEYNKDIMETSWKPTGKTCNATTVGERLAITYLDNKFCEYKAGTGTASGTETIAGVSTTKYALGTLNYWYSSTYNICLKYYTSAGSVTIERIVTQWDMTVTSFAGAGVTDLP